MATANNGLKNNGATASFAALAANLGVPIEQLMAMATTAAPAATVPAAPAKVAKPRKPKAVTATTASGVKVDLTDPYTRMVQFTRKAITVLRSAETTAKSKGIHSLLSGYQDALCKHFAIAKETAWAQIDLMTERGDIQSHPCKKGRMLYLPGEMPVSSVRANPDAVLAKILG